MALNKLENFIKNTEGRILYVNPNDLDATDAITNQGNSLTQPFKTIQRALLEAARFSYLRGSDNDIVEKTTILLFPGVYQIDNRPGFGIKSVSGTATAVSPSGSTSLASDTLTLSLSSNFDLTQSDNILYKFNSVNGGVIVPRGTSIVGLDLRKTKIRPKYIPNPTDSTPNSAIFRITGACYFWQFSLFDGDESGTVYTSKTDFSTINQATPTFSHHKLTCFEYADGVNTVPGYDLTDLDMYYSKLSNAFNSSSGRDIDQKYPSDSLGFSKQRPEWEIVGAFLSDPVYIKNIKSGDGFVASSVITVTTNTPHNLSTNTPIKINGVGTSDYNISTKVQNVISSTQFTYLLPYVRINLPASPSASNATVRIETDTVSGASPYIFNISMRSVWGMNGMHADGSKASGFRSMVVAQFTGVSLQKDDRAFVKYNQSSRQYEGIQYSAVTGSSLASQSSSTNPAYAYHLDSSAVYRNGWNSTHIKITNDAFVQIVSVFAIGYTSHFAGESGGDASITNSNSNFGENSLSASGFKKEAFAKDNTAFITSIVAPRAVTSSETNIDWVSFDVGLTTSVGISSHLYLYGFSSLDNPPPNITQGYRIGARTNDKLYLDVVGASTSTASIYMCDNFTTVATGSNSGEKSYTVTSGPVNNSFTIGSHGLKSGEKIRILSSDGDLPENIEENTVYYAIDNGDNNTIQLATTYTNATISSPIEVYGGTNLKIVSRVSDKDSGDIGSPFQYDSVNNNWFVHTNTNSEIYQTIVANGVSGLSANTDVAYVKRISDSRSIDEKLYKIRVVIPKETLSARDPVEGFIIQESSSTGIGSTSYATTLTISSSDVDYNKNPRFISTCSTSSTTITTISELPHNLNVGDIIIVKNVTDTVNTSGSDNLGYNGTFKVISILNDKTFTYSTTDVLGITHSTGTFTNDTSSRTTNLPRFQRNDLQSNYYIYRNVVISPYKYGSQDGIYQLYVLNSKNSVPIEFTSHKFNQNVVNLYPQLDRDNLNENPIATQSFAKRNPIGDVSTSDVRGSLTRETVDSFLKDFGVGIAVSSVVSSSGISTITFVEEHGLSGIVTYSTLVGGSGHILGTYYNVKLYNNVGLTTWNGATANVIVSGAGNSVTSVNIQSKGSGYVNGNVLYFDTARIGGSADAYINVTTSGITTNIGDVIQFTGSGTTSDGYYRINSVISKNQISIAKTSGDPGITSSQYGFIVSPSVKISSTLYNSSTGITTFISSTPHGLLVGNRFKVIDSNNNNLGNYLVASRVGITSFTVVTNSPISATNGYILKHGMSSNNATSDVNGENIGIRDFNFYDNDILTLVAFTSDTKIRVSSPVSGISTTRRFSLGSYIQVDGEIMRIVSSSLGGSANDEITVIRGVLGTRKASHDVGSIIKKIKPIPIEFRRPTILRSSNQTFEYLGYGPGNYSTSLPQVQVKSLTEKETYLAQSQQKSAGAVVYTGMNNNGDFYIGNKKLSSKTGQEVIFDAPIPTVTGENTARLSVVYDEVTVKERLLVEGGVSNKILSQFDGPVTFNNEIKINNTTTFNKPIILKDITDSLTTNDGSLAVRGGVGIAKNLNVAGVASVSNTTQSTNINNGALIVKGGAGINKNLYVGGTFNVAGISTFQSSVFLGAGTTAYFGNTKDLAIYHDGLNSYVDDQGTGSLYLRGNGSVFIQKYTGESMIDANADAGVRLYYNNSVKFTTTNSGSYVTGTLTVTGDIIAFLSDERLKTNIKPLENALEKVMSLSGFTYNFNEVGQSLGFNGDDVHVGVSAQQIKAVLPEAVAPAPANNDYLTVKYDKIVPLLIEAIKELKEEINQLKNSN